MSSETRKFDTSYGATDLERVTVRLPPWQLATLNSQVEQGEYPNRSAAIRAHLAASLDGGDSDT